MPVHYLFSIVFYVIVMEVAFFAAFYTGSYTGFLGIGFCGRNWCYPTPYSAPPLNLGAVNVGLTLGLFVITVILSKDYIAETLRMAFGGAKDRSIEANEPMSYKTAWLILIFSLIGLMGLFIYSGTSPWVSFVLTLVGLVTWFTMMQLWGRIGFSNEPTYNFTPGLIKLLVWPTAYGLEINSTDLAIACLMSRHWAGHLANAGWGGSLYTVIGSYRMGRLMKVHPRNMVKVAFLSLFIAMFVAQVMHIALPGIFGGTRTHSRVFFAYNWDAEVQGNFWNKPVNYSMAEVAPWVAFGFVFMVVMRFLATRFLWLPDPLVTIVAWDWVSSLHGVWFVALIDGIVKYMILKIGGSKFYEDRVVPFVGGFILGDALDVLLTGIASFILFPPAV